MTATTLLGHGFADDSLVRLACDKVKHLVLGLGVLVLERLEQAIATLGADASDLGIIGAKGDADWGTVVIVTSADALEILGVEDIVLVAWTAALLGLAGRTLLLGAGPRVGLWVDDGEVRVAAFRVAGGAGGCP